MEKMIVDNDTFFADVLQMLDQGKRVTIPVKGYSMLPFIRGGKDLVVLEKAGGTPEPDLRQGRGNPARGEARRGPLQSRPAPPGPFLAAPAPDTPLHSFRLQALALEP